MLFDAGIKFNPEPEFAGAGASLELRHSSAIFSMTSKDAAKHRPADKARRTSERLALSAEQVRRT